MAKYAWASDIHLDCIDVDGEIVSFANELIKSDPIGIFLTGDISNSRRLVYHLSILESVVQRPIYFVCGNHDYYYGTIDAVRKKMHDVSNMSQFLRYLPLTPYVALSQQTALIGHDGWYDCGHGDVKNSRFLMSDWSLIGDYIPFSGGDQYINKGLVKDKQGVIDLSKRLAETAVKHVFDGIKAAVRYHKNVIICTHVPPFKESHIHRGAVGDDAAQPWFTSKLMGDMLLEAAKAHPTVSFTVLAGHTHGRYDGSPAQNLRVHVAGAEYGSPGLASFIETK